MEKITLKTKLVQIPYVLSECLSMTASFYSSLNVKLATDLPYRQWLIPVLSIMGGVFELINTYVFQGKKIADNFLSNGKFTSLDKKESYITEIINRLSNPNRKTFSDSNYMVRTICRKSMGVIYFLGANLKNFMDIYFSACYTKTQIINFTNNQNYPLVGLDIQEELILCAWFLCLNFPFSATTEQAEAFERIKNFFFPKDVTIHPHQKALLTCSCSLLVHMQSLISCCCNSSVIRKAALILLSMAHTTEHIVPAIALLAENFLSDVVKLPTAWQWGIGISAGALILLAAMTIFLQTYLFESKESEKYFLKISEDERDINFNRYQSEDDEKITKYPYLIKKFYKLLNFGAFLHGLDSAIPVYQTSKLLSEEGFVPYLSGFFILLASLRGNYFSEVKRGQAHLQEILDKTEEHIKYQNKLNSYRDKLNGYSDKSSDQKTWRNCWGFFKLVKGEERMLISPKEAEYTNFITN